MRIRSSGVPIDVARREEGFALLGAIWLLLLSGTLIALLTLHAASISRQTAADVADVQRRFDFDAATETVAASLLIEGPRSAWSRLPAQSVVDVGGRSIQVVASGERGRLDLNETAPEIFDAVLREAGLNASTRQDFLGRLAVRRTLGPIRAQAELDELTSGLIANEGGACLADLTTFESHLRSPDVAEAGGIVKRALAVPRLDEVDLIKPGEAVRLRASTNGGASLTTISRVGLVGSEPVVRARQWLGPAC